MKSIDWTDSTSVEWESPALPVRSRIQDDINKLQSYYTSTVYSSVPQRMLVGGYTGGPRVKRRIYLIQDENKVRAIALGFRTEDREAIETWAENDHAALNLELDPSEVEVRFLTPQVQF